MEIGEGCVQGVCSRGMFNVSLKMKTQGKWVCHDGLRNTDRHNCPLLLLLPAIKVLAYFICFHNFCLKLLFYILNNSDFGMALLNRPVR